MPVPGAPLSVSFVRRLGVALGLLAAWAGCGDAGDDGDAASALAHLYAAGTVTLRFEIDYQPGAATDPEPAPLALFRDNVERLFAGHKSVELPAQPTALPPDVAGDSISGAELHDLAVRHRRGQPTATSASFYLLFLAGLYRDEHGPRPDVMGMHLDRAQVIVLFQGAIARQSSQEATRRYLQQATLLHELGHAVGLVNRGLPMVSPHEDPAHPLHDRDPGCVMHYLLATTPPDAVAVAPLAPPTPELPLLYDRRCLADVAARLDGAMALTGSRSLRR